MKTREIFGRLSNRLTPNAKWKKTFSILALSLVVSSVVYIFYIANIWSDSRSLNNIMVSNANLCLLSQNEIETQIEKKFSNKKVEEINLTKVREDLLSNPYIVDAFVGIDVKKGLDIEIVERKPIGVYVDKSGDMQFVDNSGFIFKYRFCEKYRGLVILRGRYNGTTLDTSALLKSILIANELSKPENDIMNLMTSEISYSDKDRSLVLFTAVNGIEVLFGDEKNLSEKFKRCLKFWKRYMTKNENTNIKKIDLRWANQIVVS